MSELALAQDFANDCRLTLTTDRALVGDCTIACAFLSYLGPFNKLFRDKMTKNSFTQDVQERKLPGTKSMDISAMLVDSSTTGEWNLQGLPTDDNLSSASSDSFSPVAGSNEPLAVVQLWQAGISLQGFGDVLACDQCIGRERVWHSQRLRYCGCRMETSSVL